MAETERYIQPLAGWAAGACTLDHDGCVVCSDAGIPVRVVEVKDDDALCEDAAGNRTTIAVELVQPVRVGEILLIHGGVAIGRGVAAGDAREGDDEIRR
jgi:hydrogenase expression/formation protein HypC